MSLANSAFAHLHNCTIIQDRSLLDGQAEANGAAKSFVSREVEFSCPAAGRNPQGRSGDLASAKTQS